MRGLGGFGGGQGFSDKLATSDDGGNGADDDDDITGSRVVGCSFVSPSGTGVFSSAAERGAVVDSLFVSNKRHSLLASASSSSLSSSS